MPRLILVTVLALGCCGCCVFDCGIPDLAFSSLEPPGVEDSVVAIWQGHDARQSFRPGEYKLRFTTARNLFRLQDRNDTADLYVRLTVCGQASDMLSISGVYDAQGRSMEVIDYRPLYSRNVPGAIGPTLERPYVGPGEGGRYLYQGTVQFGPIMRYGKFPDGGWGTISEAPFPPDPAKSPDLCFHIESTGFGGFVSNEVQVPRMEIMHVLTRPRPGY